MALRAFSGDAGVAAEDGADDAERGIGVRDAAARAGGWLMGGSAALVGAYAVVNAVLNGGDEIDEFLRLCSMDRTYAAFVVDLSLLHSLPGSAHAGSAERAHGQPLGALRTFCRHHRLALCMTATIGSRRWRLLQALRLMSLRLSDCAPREAVRRGYFSGSFD